MKQQITIKSRIDSFDIDVFIPDNWDEKRLILCCHGFNSGKNSNTFVSIGSKLLEANVAYATFSLPYCAERRLDYKDFTVANCIEDSEKAENVIREKYPNTQIGIIGSSYGCYLTLLRLKKYNHKYFAIILKSPAYRMDEILKDTLTDREFEEFKQSGVAYDDDMCVSFSLYEELLNNRIMDDPHFDEKMLICHGTVDSIAPFKDSVEFAKINPNTTLLPFEDEDHAFTSEAMEELGNSIVKYINN